jgi:rod shape-determining protein MreB
MHMNWSSGIDPGAYGVRMMGRAGSLKVNESAACALRGETLVALGDDARAMEARVKGIRVVYPMTTGGVADETALYLWLKYLLKEGRERVLLSRPPTMPASQMRLLTAITLDCGASACGLVRSDIACALGAGVPLEGEKARLVLQVGASQITATLVAGLRVIAFDSLPYGLRAADEAIVRMLREQYGIAVGPVTAEGAKNSLGSAMSASGMKERITGLDIHKGWPCQVEVDAGDVADCIAPILDGVPGLVLTVLGKAGPEVVKDLMEEPILLAGGGAEVYGLGGRITEQTSLPCTVAKEPGLCAVKGLSMLLDASDDYQHLVEAHQTILEKRFQPGGRL